MATSSGTSIIRALQESLPADRISEDTSAYAVEGIHPAVVVSPADEVEVASALRLASLEGAAVVPWGAGGHMSIGNAPSRYDIALDLRGLNRIVEYEPADLTVTVEPGLLLSGLQRTLAANGQWLPLDPPGDGTIGGLLAANRSGPARMLYGAARDLCIGMRVVTATGELVKSGGRVVKNVAGYDMAKLHIGAIGTLGVIVQASFKISPLPPVTQTIQITGAIPELMSTSLRIRNAGLAVNGMVLAVEADQAALFVRLAGGSAAVTRSRREIEAIAASNSLEEATLSDIAAVAAVQARISVLPTAIPAVLDTLSKTSARVHAYPTTGTIVVTWQECSAAMLVQARSVAVANGGALVIERAGPELKREAGVWGAPGGDFSVMQRLKQQFDPSGTLSPGRFIGGL